MAQRFDTFGKSTVRAARRQALESARGRLRLLLGQHLIVFMRCRVCKHLLLFGMILAGTAGLRTVSAQEFLP
ncbi:MAG TPA: hypothetical protein VGJ69_10280, partial [Pyrinomonadaceae bacterium]